jgi:hypothetical protein
MVGEVGLECGFNHKRLNDLRVTAAKHDAVDASGILGETKGERGLANIFKDISKVRGAFGDLKERSKGGR